LSAAEALTHRGGQVSLLGEALQDVPEGRTMPNDTPQQDSADRRTLLAADRTVFAAERTYAAWVRTGLAALASGVGAKKLLAGVVPEWMIWAVGTILVLFSAFSFGAAVWRQVFSGAPPPHPDTRRIPPVLLIAVNGFLVLVALSALISIWFGRTGSD
jgi:putative membrane protein